MSTTRARALRNNLTQAEVILWSRLRRLRAMGYHFRRQAPLAGYYADFACLNYRLVVELDGSQHQTAAAVEHDRVRDAALAARGFTVLRFDNAAVGTRLSDIMEAVMGYLEGARGRWVGKLAPAHPPSASRSPPSPEGEGQE
jgi:very-short-patch-repair endonuclease